ncbi:hypothetical protein [Methylocystis suflitae]|uniref:hypothetical protein n=1 Tax=Methylocystis suflitae TaxID=2951405 RepID=UPI00210BECED|nr:hypothetical protein [Methylocystis suflitae]MCQ4188853.1 hypothetical protein [Methylocystis suflitae]
MSKRPVPKTEPETSTTAVVAAMQPTPFDAPDGWGGVPQRDGQTYGDFLKFVNGEYRSGEAVMNGREFIPVHVTVCWVRWLDGRPAETLVTKPGERHPERVELGHDDESEWELGLDGRPSDPWRDTRLVQLIDPKTAQAFTFTTSSWGGRDAVEELSRAIAFVRSAGHPGALPLIRLDVGRMRTRFGPKPKPVLSVLDWRYDRRAEALAAQNAPPEQIEAQAEKPSLGEELNDSIPW